MFMCHSLNPIPLNDLWRVWVNMQNVYKEAYHCVSKSPSVSDLEIQEYGEVLLVRKCMFVIDSKF